MQETLKELEIEILEIKKQVYRIETTMQELHGIKNHLEIMNDKVLKKVRSLLKENTNKGKMNTVE